MGIRKKLHYNYLSNSRGKTCVRGANGETRQESRNRTRREIRETKRIPPYIPDVANHGEPLPNFHESVSMRVQLEEGRRCN